MFAGDHDDRRLGQRGTQPVELAKTEHDRRVRGPHGVEQIPRDDDQLRLLLEQVVHGPPKHLGDVRLALIDALGRLPVELAKTQVQVGEMGELHFAPAR